MSGESKHFAAGLFFTIRVAALSFPLDLEHLNDSAIADGNRPQLFAPTSRVVDQSDSDQCAGAVEPCSTVYHRGRACERRTAIQKVGPVHTVDLKRDVRTTVELYPEAAYNRLTMVKGRGFRFFKNLAALNTIPLFALTH